MKISIIIPAFNASSIINLVLDALTHQSYSDFEVILVDDASTDNTVEYSSHFSDRLNLQIHRLSENIGRARARNYGVQKASGELLLFLDADIVPVDDYIKIHLELHQTHLRSVGVGVQRFPSYLNKKPLARYFARRGGAKLKPEQTLPGKYFVSNVASLPKALFEEVGGFNPAFRHWGGEDQELGLRLQKAKMNLTVLPAAVGIHHHLRSLKELRTILVNYGHQGIPIVLQQHPEFAGDLRLEDLHPPDNFPVKKFISLSRRLFTSGIIFTPVFGFSRLFENIYLPSPLITYIIYRSYRQGYLKHLKLKTPNPPARRNP